MTILQRRSPNQNRIPLSPLFYQKMVRDERRRYITPSKSQFSDIQTENTKETSNHDNVCCRPSSRSLLLLAWCLIIGVFVGSTIFRNTSTILLPRKRSFRFSKLPGGYRSKHEMLARGIRFPSVDERVKLYMSSWYTPPCNLAKTTNFTSTVGEDRAAESLIPYKFLHDSSDESPLLLVRETVPEGIAHRGTPGRVFLIDNDAEAKGARIFFLDPNVIRNCQHSFCSDVQTYLFPSLQRLQGEGNRSLTMWTIPILLQFGDAEISRAFCPFSQKNESYPDVPIIKKIRFSLDREELRRLTTRSCYQINGERPRDVAVTRHGEIRMQPIISKLTYKRHFGMLDEIPEFDIPWSNKMNAAIWRGALTGQKRDGFSLKHDATLSTKEVCKLMHRCRLVLQNTGSVLINAHLVGLPGKSDRIPKFIDGVQIYGDKASYSDMLQYKAIIMLEGNGLKWALYSNSVVMTQPSTYTSWAMEELLEPWIHYIPLNENLTDVEAKMQWVIDNDVEAERIARRGTLWISDLIFHPDAQSDDEKIFDETFNRYKLHFISSTNLSVS